MLGRKRTSLFKNNQNSCLYLNNLFPITEKKNDDNGIFKDSKQTVFKTNKILSLNSHLFHLIETILKKD